MLLTSRKIVYILKSFFKYHNSNAIWNEKVHIKLLYFLCFDKGVPEHLRSHYVSYKKLLKIFLNEGFTYNKIVDLFDNLVRRTDLNYLIDLYTDEIF